MDNIQLTQLATVLAVVAAAITGLNALVGKGPRGTVWIVAACLFTWGAVLPIVFTDPDHGGLSQSVEWSTSLLLLSGVIGLLIGVLDLVQQRAADDVYPLGDWLLRRPLLWGIIVCANFFALLYQGTINSPLLWRYTAGHPVEVVEAAFFFIGMAMLLIRLFDLIGQARSMDSVVLSAAPAGHASIDHCQSLLDELADVPRRLQQTYLVKRLRDAVQFIHRKGSANELDAQLRHLEELDSLAMHSAYATLRIIIWAIPILGFLGTVIGITVAIASLSPDALEQSMNEVTQGLGVAFDTTAEALALTMILMFTKAWVERKEEQVLSSVDARVAKELVGRFQVETVDDDPNVAVIRRMSEQVVDAVEALAARQAEVWQASIAETHQQWADVSMAAGHIVKDSLSTAIRENLDQHARVLGQNVLKHADRLEASASQHVERLNRGAEESTGRLTTGLEKLGELLVEALERHGEVLTRSEQELADGNRQHLSEVEAALGRSMATAADRQEQLVRQSEDLLREMQIALVEAAGATVRQQEQLIRQADVLLKVVDATGQIKQLEESLNDNLVAVGRVHDFQDLALNLSAAIQLLSTRLGNSQPNSRSREIVANDASNQAA